MNAAVNISLNCQELVLQGDFEDAEIQMHVLLPSDSVCSGK